MPKVTVHEDETLEQALRRFNREILREGIIKELKRREFYEKPSVARKRKRSEREKVIARERRFNR